MKDIFEFLKEFMPLWLAVLTISFGYLIYLFARLTKGYNQLSEKQSEYLQQRLDSVDKTTGIFERTVKHQEGDLNRLYEVNKKLTEQIGKQKDSDLRNLDEQLHNISESIKSIQVSQVQQKEFEKLKEEINKTKHSTSIKYDTLIQNLDLKKDSKIEAVKLKRVFYIMPYTEKSNHNYQIVKSIIEELGLEIDRADEIVSAGESISEKIKNTIKKSDLIIADVTGNNENVMYELGFAHGINKPVILLASQIDEFRIDTSNYRIILLDSSKDSKEKLTINLKTTLEEIRKETRRKKVIELRDILVNQLPIDDYLKLMYKMLSWYI